MGVRIRGTPGDIDPLNKVPFKRATIRVHKGPLQGVSLILPRNNATSRNHNAKRINDDSHHKNNK